MFLLQVSENSQIGGICVFIKHSLSIQYILSTHLGIRNSEINKTWSSLVCDSLWLSEGDTKYVNRSLQYSVAIVKTNCHQEQLLKQVTRSVEMKKQWKSKKLLSKNNEYLNFFLIMKGNHMYKLYMSSSNDEKSSVV